MTKNKSFRTFNLSTRLSDTWCKFVANNESYEDTMIILDKYGNEGQPDYGYNDITYFGIVKSDSNEVKYCKKYRGSYMGACNAVSISFVEKLLGMKSIQSKIATKIFCTNKTNEANIKAAEIKRDGMRVIGRSVVHAGRDIRAGLSNVANATNNPHAYVLYT